LYKLIIKLKQHTPLIHFQHDQSGATLRATELKPKLDKFLKKYVFEDNLEKYKEYLIGYDEENKKLATDKIAFDYKVRIKALKEIEYENPKIKSRDKNGKIKVKEFPLYFGNMGESKDKYFMYCEDIQLTIFSFHKKLIDEIVNVLPVFFMKHNFGTRQSKGFGSYYINKNGFYKLNEEEKFIKKEILDTVKRPKYKFTVDITNEKGDKKEKMKKVFTEIEKLYSSLRSGLDYNKESPYIEKYAISKGWAWDKAVIKEKYFQGKKIENKDKYLLKDLFGLSTDEQWLKQNGKITKEHIFKDKKEEKDKIERFMSPIFFKPIEKDQNIYEVYFEAREIDKRFLDTEFRIKNHDEGDLILKTPEKFNFDEFFQFIFELDRKSHPPKVYKIIKEIKENLQIEGE
jgi:hypothetical protein